MTPPPSRPDWSACSARPREFKATMFAADETLSAARRRLGAALAAAGKQSAALEARILLEAATGLDALALLTRGEDKLGDAAGILEHFAARRLAGEPVNRITGTTNFFGLDLLVAPDVLDPRADTEILVETALELLARDGVANPRILDLGVGSGADFVRAARGAAGRIWGRGRSFGRRLRLRAEESGAVRPGVARKSDSRRLDRRAFGAIRSGGVQSPLYQPCGNRSAGLRSAQP